MKKVLIASFQRSGTHFLINNMATNFVAIDDGWIDVVHTSNNKWVNSVEKDNLQEKIRDQLVSIYSMHPSRKCVKTHYQMYFFERYLEQILEHYDVLYMVRDPRDVMVACFHYYNQTDFEMFIKEPVFSRFLRAELWDVRTELQPLSYSFIKPRNIIDKWNKHVLSWLPYRGKGVTFVRFRELKEQVLKVLESIQASTTQRLRSTVVPITLDDRRYRPDFKLAGLRRGAVGVWQEYFSLEDIEFLNEYVSDQTSQFLDV